jgi:uncharacterized membrane protein YkoI
MKPAILPFLTLMAVSALAAANQIRFEAMPGAVQRAALLEMHSGILQGCSTDTENGRTIYEVETLTSNGKRVLSFDASGNLVEAEEQIPLAAVPPAAPKGLKKQAAGGTIRSVESVKRGNTTGYEAVVIKNGKRREVAVDVNGNPVHD